MVIKLLLLILCAKFHEVTMDDGALVIFIDPGFTCNDGTRIRGRQLCNEKRDCSQNEDEKLCSKADREWTLYAELGEAVELLCDTSTEDKDDRVSKVSWFRNANNVFLHGFDAEKEPSVISTEWSSPTASKQKANFTSTTRPAHLMISDITIEDEGVYRCQVDFQKSPTKNSKARLMIAMKPSFVNITTKREYLLAGKSVDIECQSKGSYPPAETMWSIDNRLFPYTATRNTAHGDVSVLTFTPTEADDRRYLTCGAKNTIISDFIEDKWRLNVQYTPICKNNETEIHRALKHETVLLNCEVDANPPPIEFIWSLNSSDDTKSNQEPNLITTQQNPFFNYTPKSDSEFGILSCKARNTVGVQETACYFQIVAAD